MNGDIVKQVIEAEVVSDYPNTAALKKQIIEAQMTEFWKYCNRHNNLLVYEENGRMQVGGVPPSVREFSVLFFANLTTLIKSI
jgi:hypothetical protein